jgi:hypothetical protein
MGTEQLVNLVSVRLHAAHQLGGITGDGRVRLNGPALQHHERRLALGLGLKQDVERTLARLATRGHGHS